MIVISPLSLSSYRAQRGRQSRQWLANNPRRFALGHAGGAYFVRGG